MTSTSTAIADPHLVVPISLRVGDQHCDTHTMVDSGASDCFIDEELARQYGLPLCPKKQPVILEVVDGRPIVSGAITHETVPLTMTVGPHQEQLVLHVTTLGHYPVVFGVS